ncbi:DUF2750 domain-containing protein [Phyllobacterium sp. P30BS-XVII]|uniref:DUF2750 domain-containing protein n=1 Tax=Phyllobacterium sp. P30BS-XVII TaxID=2587046 RepID=UPI0015FE0BEC|nr:DUF2750 domain-containing protein [Phyllobacterium sp. P30BS-XVII]MBA8904186.1 hypothetical protein [Phyllobacterium sp. P30BS-XVII]
MTEQFIVGIDNRTDWQKANEPDTAEAMRVLKYAPVRRYKYFIDTVVRTDMIWLSGHGGNFVMLDDNTNTPVLCPLWPAQVFVDMWLPPYWAMPGLEVKAMSLDVMLNGFLPSLDVAYIGICFDHTNNGPILPVDKVVEDLRKAVAANRRRLN